MRTLLAAIAAHVGIAYPLAVGATPAPTALQELPPGPALSRAIIEQGIGRWRVFAGTASSGAGSELAAFAPDGRSFTVVFFRGVIGSGMNEYQLRLFQTEQSSPGLGKILLTLATEGNDPAIAAVRWINPQLVSFLGSQQDMVSQVHTLEVSSGRLMQHTHSPRAVVSYGFSRDGKTLLYAAHTLPDSTRMAQERLTGIVVRPQDDGWSFGHAEEVGPDLDLHLLREGDSAPRRLGNISTGGSVTAAGLAHHGHAIGVSPDGQSALIAPYFHSPTPPSWKNYTSEDVRLYLNGWRIPPATYARVDLNSGAIVPLGVPLAGRSRIEMTWTADSRHAFIAGYLPPEHARFAEIDKTSGAILSLDAATNQISVVTPGSASIAGIAQAGRSITLVHEARERLTDEPRVLHLLKVTKTGNVWREGKRTILPLDAIHRTSNISATETHLVGITESSDTPTEVVVLDLATQRSRTITALNPQLAALPRGRIELRKDLPQSPDPWPAQLVKPLGYQPGKRYPVVVMHMDRIGYAEGYVLDGPDYRATNPIQALASRDIAVLMVWFPRSYWPASGAEKRRRVREIVDTAYDYLVDSLALADPAAVAMTGFSHAGWVTEYGLQHTKRPYAAAVAIDNWTASYWQYVLNNCPPSGEEFYDGLSPFDEEGRKLWWQEAVGFNPHKSRTPLLKETHGNNNPVTSLAAWEGYSGRKRFGGPTELVYYPAGIHILRGVTEQLSSAERQVDWLTFWLKEEKDTDPRKIEQYARWDRMRRQGSEDGHGAQ